MSQTVELVQEIVRDRYSRQATFSINRKEILFPNFFPRIKNSEELNILMNMLSLDQLEHVQAFTIRLSNHPDKILSVKSNLNQLRIDQPNTYAFSLENNFFNKTAMIIDPACEYMYYEGGDEGTKLLNQIKTLQKSERRLNPIKEYLERRAYLKTRYETDKYNRTKKAEYKKFWYGLDRNQEEMSKLIGETHDIEILYESDILIPFVPVILNNGLLDITNRINTVSNAITPSDKHSASYYILNITTLKDDDLLNNIINSISQDTANITAIKIKYCELNKTDYVIQRENYRELMKSLANNTQENEEKVYLLFESGPQTLPSATVGFDMVSTSMTGLDGDGGFGTSAYGRYYMLDRLWSYTYDQVKRIFKNNNNNLTCSCPACTDISKLYPNQINPDIWNRLRREHYVYQMNGLMKTITTHIDQRKIELIREIIQRSQVPKLAELIPRM